MVNCINPCRQYFLEYHPWSSNITRCQILHESIILGNNNKSYFNISLLLMKWCPCAFLFHSHNFSDNDHKPILICAILSFIIVFIRFRQWWQNTNYTLGKISTAAWRIFQYWSVLMPSLAVCWILKIEPGLYVQGIFTSQVSILLLIECLSCKFEKLL